MPEGEGRPLQWWARLSLTARLATSAGLALAVAGFLLVSVATQRDAAFFGHHLTSRLKSEIESIGPALSSHVVIGDYAWIEQTLKDRADTSDISWVSWRDNRGAVISAGSTPPPSDAPDWFVRWVDLPEPAGFDRLEIGGEDYGEIGMTMTVAPSIDHLWKSFLGNATNLAAALGINFLGIYLILRNVLRPLEDLAAGADRLGGGELETRIAARGSPEMLRVIESFNNMAGRVQVLLTTVAGKEAAIHREKELAQVTLQSIGDAVITTDEWGRIAYLNPVAERLTGWTSHEAAGLALPKVFQIVNELTGQPIENPVAKVLRSGETVGLTNHTALVSRDGRRAIIEDTAAPIRTPDGKVLGVVMVFHDVTERREMERKITWQASHDPLTGLPNRQEFERHLAILLRSAKAKNTVHHVLYIDLDQFKVVNDTRGHVAGDELLKRVAAALQEHVRASDMLARLGGDEFGVLLDGCPQDKAVQIGEKLAEEVRGIRFSWEGKIFAATVSIGIAAVGPQTPSVQSALSGADAACFLAKEKGRNQVRAYEEADAEFARRHGEMHVVSQITDALDNHRLVLFYQRIAPQRQNGSGRDHREILVRIRGEDGEMISPGLFIPAAERFGLMPSIDEWVIRRALAAMAAAHAAGHDQETWAINVSGASLGNERFIAFVVAELKRLAAPPDSVCFEITETAAISDISHAMGFIRAVKSMGCRLALDDFGSGMSSFSYLKRLPVDYLKIDGAFVRDILTDRADLAVVESVNRIAHSLGLETVAEFVESEGAATLLRTLGVDYLQGYFIHRPEPLHPEPPTPLAGTNTEAAVA